MTFPDISPIALEIGPLVIRWYALAYVVGILLAQRYIGWLDRHRNTPPILSEKARDDLILYGVFGIIFGGRLGYVLFYNFSYYIDNLSQVMHIWQGGMSFHGGLIGILSAFVLFSRVHKVKWLRLMDLLAVATPVGLFLGRLANFVNGELYGRATSMPWGMVFPHGGPVARHPSQLYEAGLEGLLLGLVLWFLATRTNALKYTGRLGGVFLAGYGLARFTVEFFREPDTQLGTLALGLSMGQWLCVPMMLLGVWLVVRSKKVNGG
ncbi:MAG: prolipoprotein diacylglyceryl transferase [Rickettsiales bacterium]|nr:prolipoprotein diacylglyceryl transferase [Rickettsiales bacterium]